MAKDSCQPTFVPHSYDFALAGNLKLKVINNTFDHQLIMMM